MEAIGYLCNERIISEIKIESIVYKKIDLEIIKKIEIEEIASKRDLKDIKKSIEINSTVVNMDVYVEIENHVEKI